MELGIYRAFLTGPLVFDIMRFNCTLFLGDPYFYKSGKFPEKTAHFLEFFFNLAKIYLFRVGGISDWRELQLVAHSASP